MLKEAKLRARFAFFAGIGLAEEVVAQDRLRRPSEKVLRTSRPPRRPVDDRIKGLAAIR
jgi:hypothetical protein